jgi:hypothetical protein
MFTPQYIATMSKIPTIAYYAMWITISIIIAVFLANITTSDFNPKKPLKIGVISAAIGMIPVAILYNTKTERLSNTDANIETLGPSFPFA